jgi:anti-anti-sigma factor
MDDQVRVAGGQARASMVTSPAEVGYSNAGQVGQELASALAAGAATVIVDLTSTAFCDTAGVQEVLQAYRAPVTEGIRLRVVAPARVTLQFTWTGIDRLLAVYPSVSAALATGPRAAEG